MYKNGDFGLFIREKREALGASREHFAELCCVSDKCIANIELGKSIPKLNTVLAMCRACNVDIGELENVVTQENNPDEV